jgi:tetratricopeptide (TPR) repeat protein
MSSLITKVDKRRSSASGKVRATKGTKAASKKPQRPGKITAAPKTKKAPLAKSKKQAAPVKKTSGNTAKKAPSKKMAKPAVAKSSKKSAASASSGAKAQARVTKPQTVAAQAPPKKAPTPSVLAAVRAFEQALKNFNRHDFAHAKSAFESILANFGDQSEVAARARTYLTICEQRLARTPSAPRSPDALYNQGVFELNKGNIQDAIELFEKALKAEPRADHIFYSLSAAHARLNDAPKALDALRRAIALRSVHRSHARRDLDFASLRNNEEFQHLTGFGFDLTDE